VHLALQHTFSLAVEIKGLAAIQKTLAKGLDITIVGDNDFYSQRAKVSSYFSFIHSLSSSVISLSHWDYLELSSHYRAYHPFVQPKFIYPMFIKLV
jgi:hypothetical protein